MKEEEDMKSSRMFSILNLLVNHEKITAQELADKLEVSKRTIYRDIESLNLAGIPIVSYPGQGRGLGILANYKLDKKFFSIDEQCYQDFRTPFVFLFRLDL